MGFDDQEDQMSDEVWRDIPGYPNHEISSLGRFAVKAVSWTTSDGARYDRPWQIIRPNKNGIVHLYMGPGQHARRPARLLYRLAFPELSRAQRGARPLGSAQHGNVQQKPYKL
jgi:hypothetical protein